MTDFAMTTLDRLTRRPADAKAMIPAMDPERRRAVDRLLGEVRAIGLRR